MENKNINLLRMGLLLISLFGVWTVMIQVADLKIAGESQTMIGFSTLNLWFHHLTGVHWWMYTLTDWLSIIPLFICVIFATLGLVQLFQRKSICKVDRDLLLLGVVYCLAIGCYVLFEVVPLNYRPILIEGQAESSYPSSTILLVLCVMSTFIVQLQRRFVYFKYKNCFIALGACYSVLMVFARLWCGVHWLSDIIGAVLFSAGISCLYLYAVLRWCKEEV